MTKKNILVFLDFRAKGPAQTTARILGAVSDAYNIHICGIGYNVFQDIYFPSSYHFIDYAPPALPALLTYNELHQLGSAEDEKTTLPDFKKISAILDHVKPALVFFMGQIFNYYLKFIKKQNPRLPLIIYDALHPEGSFWGKPVDEEIYTVNYPNADAVLTIQEKSKEYLVKRFNSQNIHYFGFEIDIKKYQAATQAYAHTAPPKKGIWIVSVGSLQPRKNQVLAIEAFKKIKHLNNAQLLFIGKGSDEKRLKELILKENLGDKVKITGETVSALPYIQAADILLHTSISEGIPNVIAEAMVLGTPVISTSWEGVHEIIQDNVTGITTSFDAGEIARTIDLLLENNTLKTKLETNARQWIQKHDIAVQGKKFIDLFRRYTKDYDGRDTRPLLEEHSTTLTGAKVALYGSGALAQKFISTFQGVVITSIYDSSETRWGKMFQQETIKEPLPGSLVSEEKIIICSSYGWREIAENLLKKGVPRECLYIYSA